MSGFPFKKARDYIVMFLFDETDFMIFSESVENRWILELGSCMYFLDSWTGLTSSWNIVGMAEPSTRPTMLSLLL